MDEQRFRLNLTTGSDSLKGSGSGGNVSDPEAASLERAASGVIITRQSSGSAGSVCSSNPDVGLGSARDPFN
jgi:hypothetical protein